MAEKSATPEDQSQLAFDTGFSDTTPADQTEKVETKAKDEKPEPKPVAKAKEPPKKAEPEAEKKPEHVQITKEQFDRLMASASETDSLKTQMSKAFGTIGNVQQLVNRLQEATPKGEAIALPEDVVSELEADFGPELASHVRKALEKAFKAGVRGTGTAPATDKDKLVETEGKKTEAAADPKRVEREMVVLEDAYPDWKQIVGAVGNGEQPDPKHPYRAWLATQSESYQALINDTDDARLIERSITRFKAYEAEQKAVQTKKPEPAKPNPQTESRKQALREAVQPRGSGPEPTQNKTEADHFSEGFAAG